MSERCERTSVRTSEWLSTQHDDFIIILPIVRRRHRHRRRRRRRRHDHGHGHAYRPRQGPASLFGLQLDSLDSTSRFLRL